MQVKAKVNDKVQKGRVKVDGDVNGNVQVHDQGKVEVQAKIKVTVEAHAQVNVNY